jgi:hypothetical protein
MLARRPLPLLVLLGVPLIVGLVAGFASPAAAQAPVAAAQTPVAAAPTSTLPAATGTTLGSSFIKPGLWNLQLSLSLGTAITGSGTNVNLMTQVGYFLNRHFEIGGFIDLMVTDGKGYDLITFLAVPALRIYPFHFSRVSPYILVGAGGGLTHVAAGNGGVFGVDQTKGAGVVGGGPGAHIFVTPDVAVSTSFLFLDTIYDDPGGANHVTFNLFVGISFFF